MTDNVNRVHLADVGKGIAFDVQSASSLGAPLGAIIFFEQIPQEYVVVFEGDKFQIVWFDPSGNVLKNIVVDRDDYTEINSLGRIAIDSAGSLYILGSEKDGIEVNYFLAP